MRNLNREIESFGYNGGRQAFDEVLCDVFVAMFPSWTDEECLFHPEEAKRFCKAIRARTSKGLPDELILRCLVQVRKGGRA